MYLLGTTFTKFLAGVAAVMSLTMAVPSFECLCPDGRVIHFCPGGHCNAGRCGEGCSSFKNAKAASLPDGAMHLCCTHLDTSSQSESSKGLAVTSSPCARTVSFDTTDVAIEDTRVAVDIVRHAAVWSEAAVELPALSATAFLSVSRTPYRLTPPDLTVLFCHFTI